MNSENQTLILAGEAVPGRSAAESGAPGFANATSPLRRPLTIVAAPVDDPTLLTEGDFEEVSMSLAAVLRNLDVSYRVVDRGSAFNAANAYARTQGLSVGGARTAIIDTYA